MDLKTIVSVICLLPFVQSVAGPAESGWPPGDTFEKLADPVALRAEMPWLQEQPLWTELATPEQITLFEGPETQWKTVPKESYHFQGINPKLFGSALPAPGVHPRVFFSPEDVPELSRRYAQSKEKVAAEVIFSKSIWDPSTPDGQWYGKLAKGGLRDLHFEEDFEKSNGNHYFKGLRCSIYITHTPHLPRVLAAVAAHALFTDDDRLGKEIATVIANYYTLREPIIDEQNARGTREYVEKYKRGEVKRTPWPNDLWRGMHLVSGGDNVGLAYDFSARWMTEEQKTVMRRVLSKMTKGKRAYGQNGPIRWRDTNWVGWDLNLTVTAAAIQGEEGFDPEILDVGEETLDGYLTWGINKYGTIFETNGKNGAGVDYALKTAVVLARQGRTNYFGHPHLRKLAAAQVQNVVPAGGRNVNNGTYGCADFGNAPFLAAAYPQDAAANWLLQGGHPLTEEEPLSQYRFRLEKDQATVQAKGLQPIAWNRIRPDGAVDFWMPSPEFKRPAGKDGKALDPWERAHLALPLDFADEVHGQLNTRSSNDKDAAYLMMEARPDLYCGGHQQHDAGHFYFSALGVNWAVESDNGLRDSRMHNVVLIDGIGQGEAQHLSPSKVDWLGSAVTEHAAFASADLTRGYSFLWSSPMHYSWMHPEKTAIADWQPETDPEVVKAFKGTQNWKCRIWDHSYWQRCWGPTMRGTYNPVKYAYRTAGLVRGEHPYGLVADTIRKDDKDHTYTWQMHVPPGMQLVKLSNGMHVLRQGEDGPLLIVYSLGAEAANDAFLIEDGEIPSDRKPVAYHRLSIRRTASESSFTVLLIPVRAGQPLPEIRDENGAARIAFPGAKSADEVSVTRKEARRPVVKIDRIDGESREKIVDF